MRNACLLSLCVALLCGGCGSLRSSLGLTTQAAVDSPLTANKVFFLSPAAPVAGAPEEDRFRFANMRHAYEYDRVEGGRTRALENRNPLSIVVSRAYLPALPDARQRVECGRTARRLSDILVGEARDVAVLLEVATTATQQEFIAVWYQRDVDPGQALSFQDLLVFSTDSWDSRFPPYFRMRLVDVSNERNTIVGSLLEQVRTSSRAITGLLGAGSSGPALNTATLAAEHVLANERNQPLIDFTFQLYGAHLLEAAGGSPLGVLQEGGIMVSALPYGSCNDFWEGSLQYDYRLDRIQRRASGAGQVLEMPYLLATVIRADLAVPQVVRTRSAAILERLSDPRLVQSEANALQQELQGLTAAVDAFADREEFSRRPSKEAFARFLGSLQTGWDEMDVSTRGFLLDYLFNVTGATRESPAAYETWLQNCQSLQFNPNTVRFIWPPEAPEQPDQPAAAGDQANAATLNGDQDGGAAAARPRCTR